MDSAGIDSSLLNPAADAEVRQQYYQNASPNLHHHYGSYAEPATTSTKYTEEAIQNLIHSNNYELRRTQSTKSPMWACYRRIYNKQLDHYTGWIVCLVCRQRKPMHPKSPVREFEEHAAVCMRTEAGAAIRDILAQPGSFEVRVASTRNGVTQEILTQKTLRLIAKIASRIATDKHSGSGTGSSPDIVQPSLNVANSAGRSTRSMSDLVTDGHTGMLSVSVKSDIGTPLGTPPSSDASVIVRNSNKRPFSSVQPAGLRPTTRSSDVGTLSEGTKRFAVADAEAASERASATNALQRAAASANGLTLPGESGATNAEPPVSPSSSPTSSQRLSFQSIALAATNGNTDGIMNTNSVSHPTIKAVVMLRYNLGKGWTDAVCNECCIHLPAKPTAGDRESAPLTALREVAEEEGKPLDADGLKFRLPLDGISAVNKIVNAGFHIRTFVPMMGDEVCYLLESVS